MKADSKIQADKNKSNRTNKKQNNDSSFLSNGGE